MKLGSRSASRRKKLISLVEGIVEGRHLPTQAAERGIRRSDGIFGGINRAGHAIERIAPDFVADMSYTAFGKPFAKYLIPYETRDAGFPNPLPAVPGAIVMGGYEQGAAGGEFFFPFAEKPHVKWHYPAFGRVVEGLDEVMRWNTLPVRRVDFPLDPSVVITAPVTPPVIVRVELQTFGETYGEPVRLEGVPLPANWG